MPNANGSKAGEGLSRFSKRVGSWVEDDRDEATDAAPKPWLLAILQWFFALPFLSGLLFFDPLLIAGSVLGFGGFRLAAARLRRGMGNEATWRAKTLAPAPPPLKLQACGLIGLSLAILALCGGTGLGMAVTFGLMGLGSSILRYGLDPRQAKGPDSGLLKQAGVDVEEVMATLSEARSKVRTIERAASDIASLELKRHLRLIAGRASDILDQLENRPADIRKARRFLVTYLDGTRDVVARYRERQHDVAGTELADNFRDVLGTVERVFEEQEEALKKREALDLEIEIDALRLQMDREGIR